MTLTIQIRVKLSKSHRRPVMPTGVVRGEEICIGVKFQRTERKGTKELRASKPKGDRDMGMTKENIEN